MRIIIKPIGAVLLLIMIGGLSVLSFRRMATSGSAFTASANTTKGSMDPDFAPGYALVPSGQSLTTRQLASSSSVFSGSAASNGNDGDESTIWASHSEGDGSDGPSDTKAWWQVDLGKRILIGQLELVSRQEGDQPFTRHNIEFRGSNDATFSTYTVLASVGDTPYGPAKSTWKATVPPGNSFRYIRVAKKDNSHFNFAEFRVSAAPVQETP